MRPWKRARAPIAAVAAAAVITNLAQGAAIANDKSPKPTPTKDSATGSTSVAPTQRGDVLGKNWKQSKDRAWTTSSDAQGFHILVADKKSGYAWRTAASLSEPGVEADMWIGNVCVTGSGKRAVVAYAPRTFTNKADLMARGAFTAIVDLNSGAVTKLKRQASLAYFSPGCGTGETAVFTQSGGEGKNATRLIKVNASAAKLAKPIEVKGQVTSAVPVGDSIIAADSARIVKIDTSGRRTAVAQTGQVPFLLKPDADGGVVYMDRTAAGTPASGDAQGQVKRVSTADIARADPKKTKPATLASGPLTKMDLTSSADGHVFITGETQPAAKMAGVVTWRSGIPKGAIATTRGEALVTMTGWADGKDPRAAQTGTARAAKITLKTLDTGKSIDFQVIPDDKGVGRTVHGVERSPALPARPRVKKVPASKGAKKLSAFVGESPVDDGRTCSIPRNDPAQQTMQPKPRQVEWAVDQAITGNLNSLISRPANWKNEGMGAYQPQTLFPLQPLNGGGRIPAQVMLGITAQESNMWQASSHVMPGETGNPLIGNYYGTPYASNGTQTDPWAINWDQADCGYGITQVTDGMRMHGKEKPGETPLSTLQQQAVALDYTANVAAGVNILVDKWNQTRADGLLIDNGKPQYPENWFFALWAYNSGYYPKTDAASNGGLWGVGFTNNPANPLWKANRTPFLESSTGADDYSQAAHPQDWPYPEKVLGWAARPLQALESPGTLVVGFRPAWWTNNAARTSVKPPEGQFCTAVNECDPSKIGPNDSNQPGLGACTRSDLKCWWNQPVSWKSCAANLCGNEILRFDSTYAEQADGTAYAPNCSTTGLPDNARIIDDVPDSTPIHRPGCSVPKPSAGTFDFIFGGLDGDSARMDLHQLGSGYSGHFWFAHQRYNDDTGRRLGVYGQWTLSQKMDGEAKVLVHIPDHGAQARVTYAIDTGLDQVWVNVDQTGNANRWVDLGTYAFTSHGSLDQAVILQNGSTDPSHQGTTDVAWDAVAFVPGDYSHMPNITFPAADPNVPPAGYSESPRVIPGAPEQAARTAAPKPPAETCHRLTGKHAGEELCFSESRLTTRPATPLGPSRVKAPAGSSKPSLAATADPLIALCDQKLSAEDRDEACYYSHITATVKDAADPTKILGVGIWVTKQVFTLNTLGNSFIQTLTLAPQRIDAKLVGVILQPEFKCTPACSVGTPSWDQPLVWTTPVVPGVNGGDQHQTTGQVTSSWTNSTGSDTMALSWPIDGTIPGTVPEQMGLIPNLPQIDIRCDNTFNGRGAGCVFPNFTPTFKVSSANFPAAAAAYWVLQRKLATNPGSAQDNRPLHRLADSTKQQANRDILCPKSGVKKFVGNPNTPDASCDEYPFAATKESGGQTLESGDQCVQLYTAKDATGTWRLYPDERSGVVPTWNEICGRVSVPLDQNRDAGGDLGRFYPAARVLDGEAFFVGTPGLESCDVNSVCIEQPQPGT